MDKEESRSTHWDLMLSTAKEVAAQDNSSVSRLQEEFLEEFGRLPTSELIDYFADLLNGHDKKPAQDRPVPKKEASPKKAVNSKTEFAETIAAKSEATVLTFRKSFELTFGDEPPIELVAHFLKRLAYRRRQSSEKPAHQPPPSLTDFIRQIVSGNTPTVLDFRKNFVKTFGHPPDDETITLFLNELSIKRSGK